MKLSTAFPAIASATTAALLVSGCSILPGTADDQAGGNYPQTIDSPYGTTEIPEQPTTVAVTSSVDLDIALSLGVDPVLAPAATADDSGLSSWATTALKDKGLDAPATYDAVDGPDLDALKKAAPDVILATGLDSAEADYDALSQIAPVVASAPDDTWTDRTAAVATALDRADAAKTVVDDIAASAEDIASSHLEFEDTTYTFANVEKSSVDYLSYDGSDSSFFTGLGLLPSTSAKEYTAEEHEVKKSQIDSLDADVLFIHFPDKGKGLFDKADLADPFYREVKVIRGKHYAILDDDEFTALTNLSPLSYPWLLDDLPDAIGTAEQGEA
ncbi:ABC transporter substrate-binding protein [Brevibacterium sp. 2SA]|uniref:ABC transporter substrate-binding protein n=1 Tax=Brevibacterium sp. 2SA TaxID=2502198 RepID=UPI001485AB37|nr:ABC transporter substrate-binding protein [Brevibacterium sp. 2SA]